MELLWDNVEFVSTNGRLRPFAFCLPLWTSVTHVNCLPALCHFTSCSTSSAKLRKYVFNKAGDLLTASPLRSSLAGFTKLYFSSHFWSFPLTEGKRSVCDSDVKCPSNLALRGSKSVHIPYWVKVWKMCYTINAKGSDSIFFYRFKSKNMHNLKCTLTKSKKHLLIFFVIHLYLFIYLFLNTHVVNLALWLTVFFSGCHSAVAIYQTMPPWMDGWNKLRPNNLDWIDQTDPKVLVLGNNIILKYDLLCTYF